MKENQHIEYKRNWRDEYLKWVCAFANADGGELLIGVEDNGEAVGINNVSQLLEELPNKIASTMGLVCPVDAIERDGKTVVRITVKPSSAPVSYHGEFHIRSGATKQVLTGAALTQFILDKTGTKWDGLPVDGVTIEELDYESFEIFRRHAVTSKRMTREDVEVGNGELLDRLGLLVDGKLTRAAVLLFHRHPEKWFPGCRTRIGYFLNDADILFQDEIMGSLLVQAEHAIELLWLKYLIAPITYQGVTRVDNYPYSKDAVRELLYNALMHQDLVQGGTVQISVHRDRLYIANAGGLPQGWTVETLMGKHTSVPRNELIATAFFRAGFVERWGRGIEKACRDFKEYGNPIPKYDVHPGDIMVCVEATAASSIPSDKLQSSLATLPVKGENLPVTLPVNDETLPVAPPVTLPVAQSFLGRLLMALDHEMGMAELLNSLNMKNRQDVRERYIAPAMKYGYIEYTIPDRPTSRLQQYRLTALGRQLRDELMKSGNNA